MSSVQPLLDPLLWLRWTLASAALLWLPGHLLIGRWLVSGHRLDRIVVSLSFGLWSNALIGLAFSRLGIPVAPWSVGPAFLIAALGLGRWGAYRRAVEELRLPASPSRVLIGGVLSVCAAMLGLLLLTHGTFSAPPHLHDASNHAFMSWSIAHSGSMDPGRVFAPPHEAPGMVYFFGWHASAALLARAAAIAPYLSNWYLAIACTALLPAALFLLWRAFGFGAGTAALAAAILVCNAYTPTTLFGWGGFGALVALFLTPTLVLVCGALFRGRRTSWAVVVAGALVATAHIHASEFFLVPLLAVPLLDAARRRGESLRVPWNALGLVAVVLAVAAAIELAAAGADYARHRMSPGGETVAFFEMTDALLRAAGGRWVGLQALVVVGLIHAWIDRRTRAAALVASMLMLLFASLRTLADPISLFLAQPFYQQSPRVAYALIFLLPPLMIAPLPRLQIALRARFPRGAMLNSALVALLVVALLGPGIKYARRNLSNMEQYVAFSNDDYLLARRIAERLGPEDWIGNQADDGSFWAMHVSGIRFVDAAAWELGAHDGWSPRRAVAGLVASTWSAETLRLRERGVEHLYVSDSTLAHPMGKLRRAMLRADSRFEEILVGEDSSLFWIYWDAAPEFVD